MRRAADPLGQGNFHANGGDDDIARATYVPAGRPGHRMVTQNYVRLADPVGLHAMIARPAPRGTPETVFDSDSVVTAVKRLADAYRPAPPVRRLPDRIELPALQSLAAERGADGIVSGIDEFASPVALDAERFPYW